MRLTDFPDEILLIIVSLIPFNSNLAKVTLVSHRFRALTEPFLYRNVHLDAEPLEECRLGFIPPLKRTDQLIANLKARPELGKHTAAFSLRVTHHLWYQSHPQLSILRRMPCLRRLSFDPPAVHGGGPPSECKSLTALRLNFRHVTNHYYEDGGPSWLTLGIPLEIIARHLWHPSLRKLQAEKLLFTDLFEHELWLGSPRMRRGRSRVEDLRFLSCWPEINGNAVTEFLLSISHLKCFVLEIGQQRKLLEVPNVPSPPQFDIRPALSVHQATIEELAISTTEHALEPGNLVQSPGSFVLWTALKRLAVPIVMLSEGVSHPAILCQVLPPQLEELQLEKKSWHFSGHGFDYPEEAPAEGEKDLTLMKELAKNKKACVPVLERLIWWVQYPAPIKLNDFRYSVYTYVIEAEALESTFKSVGVEFELISTETFKDTPFGRRLYEW